MRKEKLLNNEQVEHVRELANTAKLGIDNLFTGLSDSPTGLQQCKECVSKRDLKTLDKAFDILRNIADNFDGTRKQRETKRMWDNVSMPITPTVIKEK